MSILLEGFNQYMATAGFRDVQIKDVNQFLQTIKSKTGETAVVQFFDASLIAGLEHLRFAALDALNAFRSGVGISNSVAMEIILYASAQRQIKEALSLIGIKPSTRRIAVLILVETLDQASSALKIVSKLVNGRRDDSVIDLTDAKVAGLRQLFKISDLELEAKVEQKGEEAEALVDLIIEHMALLVVQR